MGLRPSSVRRRRRRRLYGSVSQNSFSEFFRKFDRKYNGQIPPEVFFTIFDWIDFGGHFLVEIGHFRHFSDFERHFLKNRSDNFFLFLHGDANEGH